MKIKFRYIIIAIIAVICTIAVSTSMIHVHENEYILIKQFGKVERIVEDSGLTFKIPFIQQAETLPSNILIYDQAESDVITKDKKTMVIDNYVLWKIKDPLKFIQTVNTISEAERRIESSIYNAIKNNIGKMNQAEVIEGRNSTLDENILKAVQPGFEQYGIEIISNEIKRLDLPSENKASVYNRMISERNQIAAEFRAEGEAEAQKIKNETDKQTSIVISNAQANAEKIKAEGESEYMKIIAAAYNNNERKEFYEYIRALDALKISMTGENKTLFLPIDSPLTDIFLGK